MSDSDRSLECPSELALEAYCSGTCTYSERSSIDAHITACDRCHGWIRQARLDEDVLGRLRALSTATGDLTPDDAGTRGFLPHRIGEFEIVRRIGEGGMGTVFEAQQQRPRRRVALKVLRANSNSASAPQRFAREAEVLARLQHPGIAQIFEAGTAETDNGQIAYLTMELVDGVKLTDYCQQHQLGVRARLRLLMEIAEAVAHAHSRGVIHRDLKPANLLVDAQRRPRILDFGVARITDTDLHATLETHTGQIVGTLAYMSPEQIEGDPKAIDARTDVYALGVIAYELLTGHAPLGVAKMAIADAARAIRDDEPTLLGQIHRAYRGDVETLVAKALEKDKSRRYESAQAFADDIRRFLDEQPIVARPASRTYQLRKFASRHRTLVAGVCATIAALALGLAGSLWFAVSATAARADAQHEARRALTAEGKAEAAARDARAEAAKAGRIQQFVTSMLASVDPAVAGPDMKVREMLDGAATRVAEELHDDPLVQASVHHTIAKSYDALNLFQEAENHLRAELSILEASVPEDDDQILAVRSDLAAVLGELGRAEEAEALMLPTLQTFESRYGRAHALTMDVLHNLAWIRDYQGESEVARQLFSEVLAYREVHDGPEDPRTLAVMNTLAIVMQTSGDVAGALPLTQRAYDVARETLGADHPRTLVFLHSLAVLQYKMGDFSACRALFDRLYPLAQRVYGPAHARTQAAAQILGVLLLDEDPARAEEIFRTILTTRETQLGETHLDTLRMMNNLGVAANKQARHVESANWYRKAVEAALQHHRGHAETRNFVGNLTKQLALLKQWDEATQWMETLVALNAEVFGNLAEQTIDARSNLADVCVQAGKLDKAESIWTHMLGDIQSREIDEETKTSALEYVLGRLEEVRTLRGDGK
ncbi:MAG: tetratricopeptide repeat protein [Phycisphaerae bacterium]